MSKDWHQECRRVIEQARGAIGWVNDPENHKSIGLDSRFEFRASWS